VNIAKLSIATFGATIAIFLGGTLTARAASFTFYDNKSDFLADTTATQTSPWIANAGNFTAFTHDNLTFTPTSGNLLNPVSGGNLHNSPFSGIAVNGVEDLNVDIASPVYSFGFDLRESDTAYRHVESTFGISLFSGETLLTSFDSFEPSNFELSDGIDAFWGVFSDVAFDRVEIRETVGGIDDEGYRAFYTGTVAKSVPEPSLMLGLFASIAVGCCFRPSKRSPEDTGDV